MDQQQVNRELLQIEKPLHNLSEEQWQKALERYEIIEPLIKKEFAVTVASTAREAGIDRWTVYDWLEKYNKTETISSLVDLPKTGGQGKSRLDESQQSIINDIINERYLTKQKLSITKISFEIAAKCKAAGLAAPHYNTVWKWINKITDEIKLARRHHYSFARNKYKPLEGSFPGADYPLAAVQIDHTPLDIIVVDEVYREPVGKPWITMAIDVFSRMVIGFYISLDPPGALGTGLCLSNAILPKELWLTEMEIYGKWPCQGLMKSIYIDNAAEFHGKMLERACQEYGIEINFRPVATPNYGGHIERLLGTVLNEIHTLPGTTFSNTKDRKYYDAEGKACLTIKELEKWLATFIVNVYHQRFHAAINTTPFAKYTEGILGSKNQVGIGVSAPIENELKLKLDFMPFVERSVQRYGISIDSIWYYHDILRKWIHSFENPHAQYKKLRKFSFKRDPRDISAVYFFDPEIKDYFCIPYRNTSHPSITIWEHKKILRSLKERGMAHVDEHAIFEAYAQMRRIEESASTTKAVVKRARNKARKTEAAKRSIKNHFMPPTTLQEQSPVIDRTKILPFEDLEHDPFKQRNTANRPTG